jgi:hypothetical protein
LSTAYKVIIPEAYSIAISNAVVMSLSSGKNGLIYSIAIRTMSINCSNYQLTCGIWQPNSSTDESEVLIMTPVSKPFMKSWSSSKIVEAAAAHSLSKQIVAIETIIAFIS